MLKYKFRKLISSPENISIESCKRLPQNPLTARPNTLLEKTGYQNYSILLVPSAICTI